MSRPPRTARRRRLAIALAAVALLFGVVALAGGFAAVPRERLPVLPLGGTYDNGLYSVSVRSVRVVDRDPVTGVAATRRLVGADVDLLFRGDAPPAAPVRWMAPLDVGLTTAQAHVVGRQVDRRNGLAEPVQPGLSQRAEAVWSLPTDSRLRPGDAVRVGVYERYEVADQPIEGVTTDSMLVAVFAAGRS